MVSQNETERQAEMDTKHGYAIERRVKDSRKAKKTLRQRDAQALNDEDRQMDKH